MSIHRTKPNHLKKITKGFTTLPNATMELITDPATIGILLYLLSKTDNWEIVEKHLMNRFDKGRDFIRARLADLKKANLLKKKAIKDTKGQIVRWETEIYDMPFDNEIHITENPPAGKPRCLDNPTHTKLKKENEIKETTTTTQQGGGSFNSFEKQCLKLRVPTDAREPEEFIENVYHHIENNSPSENPIPMRQQMIIKMLKKLNGVGAVFHSKGYVSRDEMVRKEKQKLHDELVRMYNEYVGSIKSDIFIKHAPADTKILSFEEWSSTHSS